ncbi:MAG: dihydrodipicolinate synthase family protein [Acidimicrobiia bacterium]
MSVPGPRCSCSVIAITPFAADGSLDERAVRAHLRRMHDAGIGVYVGGGGSGEGFTLTDDEMRRLLAVAADELDGNVRAMGIEPRTAAQMIAFTQDAARAGVEAVQVYSLDPGHGHRPTMPEVQKYFDAVLDACPLPAVVSTHQSVGYRVPVPMLADLVARHEGVIGVHCSHADVMYLAALVDALGEVAGDRIDIHVGGPLQTLTAVGLGAHGFLTSEANLAPNLCAALCAAIEAGDLAAAAAAFGVLARLHELLYGNGGIRVTKALLGRLGLPGGTVRPPQVTPDDAVVDAVLARVRELGIPMIEGWA